jgi:PhzF family phenazine biosynthesis protein
LSTLTVHRLAAFTDDPMGGNPAGVVLSDKELDPALMQTTAAEVAYSETAFLWPADQERHWHVRYFSPQAEVPFCGHATIATGALLARLHGDATHVLYARPGEVALEVAERDGRGRASLTSVEPELHELSADVLAQTLTTFGWEARHLSPEFAPAIGFAGARHLLLPVRSRSILAEMRYDFDALLAIMLAHDLTTINVLWRESADVWHARNAFPVGGVIEDPATGAAAAAFGGWLRITERVSPPSSLTVRQGEDMGRPSQLDVHVPVSGGIVVAGNAVAI